MDLGTLLGIVIAVAGILIGQAIEGGSVLQILQPTAAMIVFGGTLGAVMISFPMSVLKQAAADLLQVLKEENIRPNEVIDEVVRFTNKARREGIISLEKDAAAVKDEFFKKSIMMAVDGSEPKELRQTMKSNFNIWKNAASTRPKCTKLRVDIRRRSESSALCSA